MSRLILSLLVWLVSTAAVAASPQPILVLGDSLSSAYRIAPEDGWVHLLRARLDRAGVARRLINASIAGETSAGGLERLPELLAKHHPALVIVELGANDGLRGLPLATIRDNLTAIVTRSRDAGARVVLLGIELPVNYGPHYRDGLRTLYRDLSREFNLPLVPFLLEGVALDPALMQEDGLHPTAAGEPKVLDNVWAVLEPALRDLAGAAPRERKKAGSPRPAP
ncbi:MAG TPA: arylesterase [Rhodanobacteraceae bacterium]|nr:arylesterase [Rhodanobacteraceae bacterium]